MVDRVIKLEGRGLRGESFADVARRVGTVAGVPVSPSSSDGQILDAMVDAAGYSPVLQASVEAAISNAQLAELAALTAPGVYEDTAAGLAAVAEGETFWVKEDDGLVLYRKVGGSAEMVDIIGTTVNVVKYGADPTGVADSSLAFQLATNYVASRGGGVVFIPPGEYEVEGVIMKPGVAYRGVDRRASFLRLPASPSQSMFVAEPASSFNFGGFFDLWMNGRQDRDTALYDCIDFSAVNSLITYSITRCYIEHFRRGFNGSLGTGVGNDRFAVISECSFWDNDVGIFTNEHAFLHSCELRANNVGLDGRINDFFALNTRFVSNKYGVNRDGALTNAQFFACSLWKNSEIGARLGRNSSWVGGRVAGNNNTTANDGYGDVGFLLLSHQASVKNVTFGQGSEGTSFGGACVRIHLSSGVSGIPSGMDVSNNKFLLHGAGIGVDCTDPDSLTASRICDNTVETVGKTFMRAVRHGMSKISGNMVEIVSPLPAGAGVFDFISTAPGQFSENVIGNASSTPMSTGHALTGSMGQLVINDNIFRGFAAGAITAIQGSAAWFRNNYGYKTEASGSVTINEGETSLAISHGLARTPRLQDFTVTPINLAASETKWRISGVNSTTFTITLAEPAGQSGGSAGADFGWQARIY